MPSESEIVTQCVESVGFSFLTPEEVKKLSVVKITDVQLLDTLNQPVVGGLYDPAMGPVDDITPCKLCGQHSRHCTGHCGHIDLVLPVYNPLLFNMLSNLLKITCFSCFHFMASRSEVDTCVSKLELIAKGDVIGAKRLESPDGSSYPDDSDGSHLSCSTVHSGAEADSPWNQEQHEWTSLQLTEAMSILNEFLRKKVAKCQNCGAKNPKINKPTFGWFRTSMLDAHRRANIIRGLYRGRPEGRPSGAEDIMDSTDMEDGVDADEIHNSKPDASTRKASAKNKDRTRGEVFSKQKGGPLLPTVVKNTVELLWSNEDRLCSFITDIQQQGIGTKADTSIFFLETIIVPPTRFRPPAKAGDEKVMEHPQTALLKKVLESNIALGNAFENKSVRLDSRWLELQQAVNILFDSKTATGQKEKLWGICQLLEKKEGMFRQKMMGKRVNFACRSVISPDPYLAVNEIGIPPYFASRLTYPERVTPWNVSKLRNAIINGPENHPGATHYDDKLSFKKLPTDRKSRISISRKLPSSRGAVMERGRGDHGEFEGKIVYRHLQDGDIVLVNRQPTLHKPSIMAHVVRVLKGEKTIRMHYANCSTYNADFDGDEMNVHFPQDEISRAEAYNIVNANNQYVVPSHGAPIRSLIQDHIVSAVLLTMKDTFLTRDQFHQLLYSSGVLTVRPSFAGNPGRKVIISYFEDEMQTIQPAIWKPEPLWTGKQVITAVLSIVTRGRRPFTVGKKAKLDGEFFKTKNQGHKKNEKEDCKAAIRKKKDMEDKSKKGKESSKGVEKGKVPSEKEFFIYKNDLICGVLDKAQFGDYGMVHMVQELYGSNTAGILLSALSRLFTAFLQMYGFTCGVDDLMMIRSSEEKRSIDLNKCEENGEKGHFAFLGVKEGEIDKNVLPLKIEEAVRIYGESGITGLDVKVVNALRESQKSMKDLLSEGLCKPSVKNCFSLMTASGAKGSMSNFQQVCSYLGQQELEGKRVPRMVSGKTLPCFSAWDCAPRAGGFIADRFLSGLRPQEYYFHCMAGREGLVDTAVKTSRSGYLQRCLIKNLECLKVGYDHTVRDADGSIVQFVYGEDGVDVHQTGFIANFELLASNQEVINEKYRQLDDTNTYIKELPAGLITKAEKFIEMSPLRGRVSSRITKQEAFLRLMMHKYQASLAQPGEPVGVIAAQSVGEPSTQMTLNTFHHAGRGEANVTLGIPRLQEILMRASSDIQTPIMTCPLLEGRTKEDAEYLAAKLRKITVADIVKSMKVSVVPFAVQDGETCSIYKLKIKIYSPDHFPEYYHISLEDCVETLEVLYIRELEDAIQNHLSLLSRISGIKYFTPAAQSKTSDEPEGDMSESGKHGGDDDDNDKDDEEAEDLGGDAQKQRQEAMDEVDYEDGSEEEQNEDEEPSTGSGSHSDQEENDKSISENDMGGEVSSEMNLESDHPSETRQKNIKSKSKSRKKRARKEYDRAIYESTKGLNFEVHFKFTNEPHLLLAEIAQKTANKVYVQHRGKIHDCQPTNCQAKQVIYYGKNPKERKDPGPRVKEELPALQTAGVDFNAFWNMQDDLDVRYIYSNNIREMLNVYGVEAARETIVREVNHVFASYSVSVNSRHLSLIADYMTFSGSYRPMNRLGSIAESISPFCKITFETASKFIVEAACHGLKDNLESPSARICLGLPVKVGTGCFDLFQKV